MSLQASTFAVLDDLSSRLAGESIFAKAHSDEGLIPSYSLLTEMMGHLADAETPELQGALQALHSRLDALLTNAQPFDEAAEKHLKALAGWLPGALNNARKGAPFAPMAAPADVAAPPSPPEAASENRTAAPDEVLQLDLAENRELLGEFHSEALDHLQQIEAALLVLDTTPNDRDALNGLFRSFHTIKGVSGFLHLAPMHRLTHEVESLLDLVRTERLRLTPAIVTEILNSRDAIQTMMGQITLALEQGRLPDAAVPVAHLITAVRRLAVSDGAPAGASSSAAAAPPPASSPITSPPLETGAKPGTTAASSVRVNTEKLDSLVDVVGELVIVQSQLVESAKGLDTGGSTLPRNIAQLGRITKELQLTAMSLRMVPIKPTFQRMERLVRDLSRDFGKQVAFETRGEDTEIDRTVVEEIVDPLVHMVRNSLDHGLESAEVRRAAGKPEQGRLSLGSYHEGSNLVIELTDDGRGIDRDRVLAKARSQGLVADGAAPGPDEILNLIFLPGFSTAEKVTAVSGRGVGMDVVRRNIERLRGQVQIETELGRGTTFRIRLPLTTAIIDGLLVRVGEDRFILPTVTVQMAMRPSKGMLTTIQGSGEVIDHRGHIIPLHRLHRRFGIEGAVEDPAQGIVVIMEIGVRVYALLVDELLNKQEVVIKNLGSYLQNLPGVAGGAILGDGTIALILDPASLCSG
ncbi:MAG: chemotaxis protein CheA [Opitutaceae bacterium]|jgi:two-component system chemotaxis sensor kinase CheA